jgi:hypothetical protein
MLTDVNILAAVRSAANAFSRAHGVEFEVE